MPLTIARRILFVLLFSAFLYSAMPAHAVTASGSTFVVTDATDNGCILACPVCDGTAACSLRQAISKTSEVASGTFNLIRFSAAVDWSANPIMLLSPLPLVDSQGTSIDGRTPANVLVYPSIDARNADGDYVFSLYASYVSLSNLSVYNADPNFGEVIVRQTARDHHTGRIIIGAQVGNNWLGAPRASSNCSGVRYGGRGIRVDASGGSGTLGGGTVYIFGNVVACHGTGDGIYLAHDFESLSIVTASQYAYVGQTFDGSASGNWVGLSPSGSALPNQRGISICQGYSHTISSNVIAWNWVGVSLPCAGGPVFYGATYDQIGVAGRGNTIYGNTTNGIYLGGFLYHNSIQGNTIGLDTAGFAVPNGEHGIRIELGTTNTLIGGYGKAGEGNLISGNTLDGIHIDGATVVGTLIQGNQIGTSPSGTAARGNHGHGIAIHDAQSTALGGATGSLGNVISGNLGDGVHVDGASTFSLTLSLNLIGTSANGLASVGNQLTGVVIDGPSNAGASISDNTISGNGGSGVWIKNSAYVTLTSNRVGLNAAGSGPLANGADGVRLTDGAQHNLIGDATGAGRNIISGNTLSGVVLSQLTTNYNQIASNIIGLNATGTAALPNGYAGIALFQADLNTIGGGGAGHQIISGNGREGIYVADTYDTSIDGTNYIGVGSDSISPIGNGLQGIMLTGDVQNTLVAPALVAYSGAAGVALAGPAAGNRVYPQAVHSNGGLAIDLGNDGPTPNDPGDADSGPNTLQNYPTVTLLSGSSIGGTACANCRVLVFRAVGNPAAPHGGYSSYSGSAVADGAGSWSYTLTGALTPGNFTLMTCSLSGCASGSNTSELRPRLQILLPLIRR